MADQLVAKIVRVRDAPQLSAIGTVTQLRAVDYMVGTHGPFTLTVPLADFTALKVKQAVDEAARELITLLA